MGKTFDREIGIKTVYSKNGKSKLKMKVVEKLLNHGGIAHGGVIASFCDCVLAEAIHNKLPKNKWCVTVEISIDFMEPANRNEILIGEGKLVRMGKTLAFVEGKIKTEKSKKFIAKATGIWFIKNKS